MKKNHNNKIRFFRAFTAVIITAATVFQLTGCLGAFNFTKSNGLPKSSRQTAASVATPSLQVVSPSVSSSSKAQKSSSSAAAKLKAKPKSDVKTIKKINKTVSSKIIEKKSVSKNVASVAGYSFVYQNSGYNSLTSNSEKNLYQLIGDGVYKIAVDKTDDGYYPTGKISMPGHLSEAQIMIAITAYLNDNPQVFWITNSYSYSYTGNETTLQMYSYISSEDCTLAIKSLNSGVTKVMQSMPLGLNEFDREEYLFDYLVNNCSYDYAAVTDSSRWQAFTAYGAVTSGKIVCEGYSRAMQILSSYAGIHCMLVRGESGGSEHMWNAININGNWYHLDITWCDNTFLIYNYFNITDNAIKTSHIIAPLASNLTDAQIASGKKQYNLSLPSCKSTQDTYYNVKGIRIASLNDSDDNAVVQALAVKLKAGKKQFAFRINEKLDYNSTVKGLLENSPYKMSTYLKKAVKAAGISLNIQKVNYIADKDNHGLNVRIG